MPSTPSSRPPPSPDLIHTKVPPSYSSSLTTSPSDPDPPFTLVKGAKSRHAKGSPLTPSASQFGHPATPSPTPTSPHTATTPDVADAGKKPSTHTSTKSHAKIHPTTDAAVLVPPTPTSDDEKDGLPLVSSSLSSSSLPPPLP